MIVYRLSKSNYAQDFMGTGAKMAGGRWNSKGNSMLYTSQTIALCAVEVAVHLPLQFIPKDYVLLSLEVPNSCKIIEVSQEKLPLNWTVSLHGHTTQEIGDNFLKEGAFLALKVPSAVIQGEFNYLFNPFHPDFHSVKCINKQGFRFDQRLFKR